MTTQTSKESRSHHNFKGKKWSRKSIVLSLDAIEWVNKIANEKGLSFSLVISQLISRNQK